MCMSQGGGKLDSIHCICIHLAHPNGKWDIWDIPHLGYGTFGKWHIWEVATWEVVTTEVTLGKILLEKYLTP